MATKAELEAELKQVKAENEKLKKGKVGISTGTPEVYTAKEYAKKKKGK